MWPVVNTPSEMFSKWRSSLQYTLAEVKISRVQDLMKNLRPGSQTAQSVLTDQWRLQMPQIREKS